MKKKLEFIKKVANNSMWYHDSESDQGIAYNMLSEIIADLDKKPTKTKPAKKGKK